MQFVLIKAIGYCIIHGAPAKMTTRGSLGELQVVLINSIKYNAANVAGKPRESLRRGKGSVRKHKCNISVYIIETALICSHSSAIQLYMSDRRPLNEKQSGAK